MKPSKTILTALLIICLSAVMLSGCHFYSSFGISSLITGESYPNAASYQTGAFTYRAESVTNVEIYWRCGEVEIVESDHEELRVRESGGELSEEAALHYLLDEGTLRIRFCESGAKIQVHSNDKRLTIEVPKDIDLSIHTTSAPIKADTLEQNSILISAHSGRTELGTVKADSVDLSSSSGSIRADSISTENLKCNTSSGSVRIEDLETETLDVETSSGGVELDMASASLVEIHTTSGGIDLTLAEASQADIRTTSGKTRLCLPESGAEIDYSATSGRLHTGQAFEKKGDLYVFGDGESRITVVSTSGNLEIH